MPGYKGHIPSMHERYGETFSNKTQKYFQDYRSAALNESRSNYCKGGEFPAIYSNDPRLVTHMRFKKRELQRTWPNWTRYNNDYDRTRYLQDYHQKIEKHRNHYRDKTRCAQREDYFIIPKKNHEFFGERFHKMQESAQNICLGPHNSRPIPKLNETMPPLLNNPPQIIQANNFLRQGNNPLLWSTLYHHATPAYCPISVRRNCTFLNFYAK